LREILGEKRTYLLKLNEINTERFKKTLNEVLDKRYKYVIGELNYAVELCYTQALHRFMDNATFIDAGIL